ncbi:tyrosine-type recombinase/integrase [Anaeromyxobacter dehalogenans]|uniref:Phage integrase n=1 Tax=Anaeromyxobacter dehalogenans (strain 2CP-C) TaxID=290397 RepID=Q2IIX8_ANADE|nr:tyrosine-type recombinase/integrase [Anaeromyxobacter dehalogenans]ABC81607.1 Phage integrase [Anaeromyxobacter dehalogenans 2CP-C]
MAPEQQAGRASHRGSWIGTWEGGRIWRGADGTTTFHIQRMVAGRRYSFGVATSHRAAIKQLERFESDPAGFQPGGTPRAAPLFLDNELVEEFVVWSAGERANTAQWVGKQKAILTWWMERLRGVDLRRASLRDHILPPLEGATSRRQRIAVLKALYSWLRKRRHLLTSADDCTLDLSAPAATPEQWRRLKTIPRDHIDLVIEYLRAEEQERRTKHEQRKQARRQTKSGTVLRVVSDNEEEKEPRDAPWSDVLTIQAGTGWHTTEVVRFAASGSIEPLPQAVVQDGVAGVLICPMHKSGEPIRTRVSAAVVDAAKRLLEHGAVSREWYDRAVRAACKSVKRPDGKVGIPVFTPGRLRHSVATWAIESGADPAAVAAFLGHKSARTTKRFYATHASVRKVPTLV